MPADKVSPVKKNIISAIVFSAIIALIIVPFILFKENDKEAESGDDIFLYFIAQSSVLQDGFQTLKSLNQQYLSAAADSGNIDKVNTLDSLQVLITNKQSGYSALLDSIQANASSNNQNSFDLFNRIIQSYRSAFNESVVLNKILSNQVLQHPDYTIDSSLLLAMKNELKKNQIEKINLSQQLNQSEQNAQLNSPQNFKKLLKEQDTTLYNMLASERERNKNLISYNAKLEKDIINLKSQLQDAQQAGTQSKPDVTDNMLAVAKNEAALGKVDCYLLRADPAQIISNSKQRRSLLEDALNILNTLSATGNADVQEQVKARMARLQKIAAANHD